MSIWEPVAIIQMRQEVNRLNAAAHSDAERISALEERVKQLWLTTAALWELLCKTSQLSEDQLKETIAQLQAGRQLSVDPRCPACHHRIAASAIRCLYCGAAVKPAAS